MPKITGAIKESNKPFTGVLIVTHLSGKINQYPVKSGKPDEDIELVPGAYNVSFVPESARKQSSYPQYKWRIPEGEDNKVPFDQLEVERLV